MSAKENIRIMCLRRNYLPKNKKVPAGRSFSSLYNHYFYQQKKILPSKAKMVKIANIVPLIIYLLIYIFLLFFFRQPLKNKQGKSIFSKTRKYKSCLWVRVIKFHKLATTEAFLSSLKQMKIRVRWAFVFDLFNKEQQREGAKTKAGSIEILFKLL